ncbi:MAG: hypothetical protein Q7S65_01690 [Nanoarchaeota archaeon]|nr:hypothetical protein [Nanoarchaeota archaeon]
MSKLLKHDQYVQELCQKISPSYDLLLQNVPIYSPRKRLIAEIDILAMKEGVYDLYEVKCSHRMFKARRQLVKARRLMAQKSRVGKMFFFCGESGILFSL